MNALKGLGLNPHRLHGSQRVGRVSRLEASGVVYNRLGSKSPTEVILTPAILTNDSFFKNLFFLNLPKLNFEFSRDRVEFPYTPIRFR